MTDLHRTSEDDQIGPLVTLADGSRRVLPATVMVDALGNEVSASGGSKDAANSSQTPLGAGAIFVGEWVQNNDAQIAFNALSDQNGELFLEFSIDGTTALQTLSKRYEVFANQGEFDALIKMPGRFHRIRYVNGATAQTKFGLITATGDGLYPYLVGGRNAPKLSVSNGDSINSTRYRMLVDLSDRVKYPHNRTGHADITSAFFFVDRAGNTVGQVQLGVITAINGTSAAISFVQGVSFKNGSDRSFSRDRIFTTPISCAQSGGKLTGVATGFQIPAETLVNTATPLPCFDGTTATPAVGDLVARYVYTSGGTYDAALTIQYTTNS